MHIRELLCRVTKDVGLDKPDGRPLYAYRCDPDLATNLLASVGERLRVSQTVPDEVAAGFCLGAAYWTGQVLDEGRVTWRRLWQEAFRLPTAYELSAPMRDPLTTRGLRWWRRPVIRLQTNRYLSSLVVEGGLAARLLDSPNGPLNAYVLDVLTDHERFPSEPLEDLARRHDGRLAPSYRNATVHTLIGALAAAVAEARLVLAPRVTSDDPLETLRSVAPTWWMKLPLELSDQAARNLIVGLLKSPAAKAAPSFAIVAELTMEGGEYQVARRLISPDKLVSQELEGLMKGSGLKALPSQANATLETPGRQRHAAKLAKRLGQDEYRVESLPSTIVGAAALGNVSVVLTRGHNRLAELAVPGGDALPLGPWVFGAEGSRRNQWIGAGSMSLRDHVVLVAVPGEGTWSPVSRVKHVGTMPDAKRDVYQLESTSQWADDESLFAIRLAVSQSQAWSYELRGERVTLGNGGSEVWSGPPEIVRKADSNVAPVKVPGAQIEWRSAAIGSKWTSLGPHCLGAGRVRHVELGATMFSAPVTIFPKSFELEFKPQDDRRGRVIFRNLGASNAAVAESPLRTTIGNAGAIWALEVDVPDSLDPVPISLRFDFQGSGSFDGNVECPVEYLAVVDSVGRKVAIGNALTPIPVSQLAELTLRARFLNGSAVQLKNKHGVDLAKDALQQTRNGGWAFPLGYIQDACSGMLAGKTDRYATMDFEVWMARGSKLVSRIYVARHGGKLVTERTSDDWQTFRLGPSEVRQPWFVDRSEFVVHRLIDPEERASEESVVRESDASGGWRVHVGALKQGPWLATVEGARGATTHPILLVGRSPAPPDNLSPLEAIVNILDNAARWAAIGQLIDDLAKSPNHPDWSAVERILKRAAELPATTFDVLELLALNPLAAAQVALRFPNEGRLWERFQDLPFLWAVIGLRDWTEAARLLWNASEGALSDDERLRLFIQESRRETFEEFCRSIPSLCPGLEMLRSVFNRQLPEFRLEPSRNCQKPNDLRQLARVERTRLIDAHESRWPGFQFEPSTDVGRTAARFFDLAIPREGWRNAVLTAPIEAAGLAAASVWPDRRRFEDLQELRGFDPEWFDQMHALALEWIITQVDGPWRIAP